MKSEYLKKNWQEQSHSVNTNEPVKKVRSVKAQKQKPDLGLVRKHFGIVDQEHYIPNIRFEYGDGRVFLLPYAHQAFIEYDPEKGITLSTMQRVIIITGQRLSVLLEYLHDNRLSWLKESKSKLDNEKTEIFIMSFEVRLLTS